MRPNYGNKRVYLEGKKNTIFLVEEKMGEGSKRAAKRKE